MFMFGGSVSEGLRTDPTRNHNRMFISTLTDTFRCSSGSVIDSSATLSTGCSITPAGTFARKFGTTSPTLCSAGTTNRHRLLSNMHVLNFVGLETTEQDMAVAGSVGKASRKKKKGREPANADCQPLVCLAMDSHVHRTVTLSPSCGRDLIEENGRQNHLKSLFSTPPSSF
ncbi:hypothetical protein BLNAU_18545 [Blattamonas nauphoetae]|uniref:Uncharacterized protein n=1 Tax=Blattamonas nauphoetae TaxID=2049346 RepID=A0ABQ9X4J7_9EUKA|nr:hypothetical protein BLNAU_18545 [Blattamonas nauphoetae]